MFIRNLNILKGGLFKCKQTRLLNILNTHKLTNTRSLSYKQFCSKKVNDTEKSNEESNKDQAIDEDKVEQVEKSEIEKELEETDEEIQRKRDLEEKKKMLAAVYTEEELNAINESGREIIFNEIKEKNKKKLLLAKRLSIYLNIPLSIALMFLIDYLFGDTSEIPPRKKPLYYACLFVDYHLFLIGITILAGCRNIVLKAKYIPKEKAIEFTKLTLFSKPYTVKEKVADLKRVGNGRMTPFMALKNKITNSIYSMNSVGEWKDRKLYNALYPPPIRKAKNKKDGKKFLDL